MAFLSTAGLKKLFLGESVIKPFDEAKIKNGSYELSLGSQVFQTGRKPRAVKKLKKNEKIYIEPGQFALLLTEEVVTIPEKKIAFISIKAKVKFEGLVNVSGFHVDPGFNGKLLFSVYNAGPSTIVLSQGTSYFPIWFAELDESQSYDGHHRDQSEIPDAAIRALSQGDVASPNELSKQIHEVKHLKTKIEWVGLAVITLLTALLVKVWTDARDLKKAVEYGYLKKSEELTSELNLRQVERTLIEVKEGMDSLVKVIKAQPKLKIDSLNKADFKTQN
jgi:dCTP deaminase